jgi:sulfatase maturation enzyme AslB (radical SAM superfamily)
MGVSLLHKCNFNCDHCGYIYIGDTEDHIIRPGYRLTWDQVMTAIRDCTSLKDSYWNMNFTGGEPTLWEEDGKDLVDILIATARAGVLPTYNTNASYFNDYDRTCEFFQRYLNNSDTHLKTFISMDKFHKNYNPDTGRAKSLDNIVRAYETFPEDRRTLLSTHVVIIVTRDPDSSLPEEMKKHYGSMGITFGDFPMLDIGKAKDLKDQMPEFSGYPPMPVKEGGGPPVVVLVGDDYYVVYKKTGKLGRLPDLYPNARQGPVNE